MKQFKDEVIVLDATIHRNTTFDGCVLVYRGGIIPVLQETHFNNCQWRFEGSAENTISMLRMLLSVEKSDGTMRESVLKMLNIRPKLTAVT